MTQLTFQLGTAIVSTLFIIAGVFILAYWFYKVIRKSNDREEEYGELYAEITTDIKKKAVTSHNYDVIYYKLKKLGKLPWKNKEKTVVLSNKFWIRFAKERTNRINEPDVYDSTQLKSIKL